MTVILVDKADEEHDLQLANRTWHCIVSNLAGEKLFDPEVTELLGYACVGELGTLDAQLFAEYLKNKLISQLSNDQVLFEDGRVGEVTRPKIGFALDTPYHLVSHISKATLQELYEFVARSEGFDVL